MGDDNPGRADGRTAARTRLILTSIAAVLAVSASAVPYFRRGEVDLLPAAGGLFLLALALGAWQAGRRKG